MHPPAILLFYTVKWSPVTTLPESHPGDCRAQSGERKKGTAMSRVLEGKTALVTGGAHRIGRAIVLAMATHGANVVIHYNSSAADAESTAADARAQGVDAWTICADLSDARQAEGLVPAAHDFKGGIDILINNAAVFPRSTLESLTPESLGETVAVNAIAPLIITRAFARLAGEGTVVNILDSRIRRTDTGHVSYQLSKNMLASLTRLMALEYAPHIRVNGVAPGLIMPPPGQDGSYLRERLSKNILHRSGTVEDVADAVLFLVTGKFITGETVFVDGGENIRKERE